MSTRDLIEGEAELDDEEGEESFDEETGEVRERRNGGMNDFDDSSEEEDDDDDEEAARAVREGFIVDEDEDEEEREQRRRARKKRRREEREQEDAVLDEEDLDLIGEANPDLERVVAAQQSKFKRLKRGHKEDRGQGISNGIEDIFSDDEEETPADYADRRAPREGRRVEDEFADFIEEDEFDDEERGQVEEDLEVRAPTSKKRFDGVAIKDATGLDDLALEDMRRAFGDGTEYDWALEQEAEMEEDEMDPDQPLELKDVFEPSQIVEKMLTDEDNEIRQTDEPERFQIARKPYKHIVLTDEQFKEEATWISNLMLPRKRLDRDLHEPFQRSVAKVLEFMTTDDYEVPFIFQHRKDYLIHASKIAVTPDPLNPAAPEYTVSAEKLLNQTDLWDIFDMDLKFRALVDKRNALQRTYDNLKDVSEIHDPVFEDMLPAAVTMEELQDIQDYLHFQYSSQIKDLNTMNGETNGTHRRPGAGKTIFDRIRNGKVYNLVRAFGLSADAFAQNALKEGRRQYTEDPNVLPDDMADGEDLIDPPEFSTGAQVLKSAKMMFAEEIANNPKMRKVMRRAYYQAGVIDCFRTEKGLRRIDEQHPYYEFKYLRNQPFSEIARQPDLLLKMLKAEEDGLVEVRVRLEGYDGFKDKLFNDLASDNFSEIADAWNRERREVLDLALSKLERIMAKGVKENMKTECENQVAKACREEFTRKLDQAPYKPKGMVLGTVPRVLALSNGQGNTGRDAVCWAWVEEDGRVLENGKFSDLRLGAPDTEIPDSEDVNNFKELVQRRKPDVIAVSGFSVQTKVLTSQLQEIVDRNDLTCPEYEDEDGNEKSEKLEVIIVNDEVARLYQTSDRAAMEYPALAPLTRYCVALAKYVQNPMKEYAALGRDIVSISFHPSQQLLPQDKVIKQLETAMVDMVNLVGVNINDAVSELYTANLLQYVSGLGPRKAQQLLKAVNINGGVVTSRAELVGDPEEGKLPAVGPRVWNNCASFVYIDYESSEDVDYLDNTRVHPEDYDLGRKMAADALELDEEDIKAETDENGHGAIVRKLIKDEAQEKVNDLILEEYAEQLERNFNQRKRATLETIRAELQQPYEELRRDFGILSSDEIFTMFTGETRDSLCDGMIVPMVIRRVTEDHLDGRLDCGIGAVVMASEAPAARDVSLRQMFSMHQTVQAKVLYLDRKKFDAQLSLREEELRRPYRKHHDRMRDEWDYGQEERDKEALQEKNKETGRTQRVVRHPLFRAFNSAQAEEFLGSQARGDVVIRPSSKGMDHLAVTWKVSDNVYQHIDVLELDKDNEFAVGKTLKIGGRYTYTDLDELIVNHVKAMARKVDEMMGHEKYQTGSKSETERWLTTYTEANPKRSAYAFCIDPKHPGFFHLCFKAGQHAPLGTWPVKVIPNAFELQRNTYSDMRNLCNGFKTLFQNMQSMKRR